MQLNRIREPETSTLISELGQRQRSRQGPRRVRTTSDSRRRDGWSTVRLGATSVAKVPCSKPSSTGPPAPSMLRDGSSSSRSNLERYCAARPRSAYIFLMSALGGATSGPGDTLTPPQPGPALDSGIDADRAMERPTAGMIKPLRHAQLCKGRVKHHRSCEARSRR